MSPAHVKHDHDDVLDEIQDLADRIIRCAAELQHRLDHLAERRAAEGDDDAR